MEIRFIKLGNKGAWEKECIENGTIRLGYDSTPHKLCLARDWIAVKKHWLSERSGKEGAASNDVSQIRAFYELKEDDIWVTIYLRRMYWCHAEETVTELSDGSRVRKVIGSWKCEDDKGHALLIDNIDGQVTMVQGFRGTICRVHEEEYLIRKIKGDIQPEIEAAHLAVTNLKKNISALIKGLWWGDFELLVELIFSRLGFQRMSILGKQGKDIDIDLYSPLSGKRAFVQVKSNTSLDEITRYYDIFKEYKKCGLYAEMFYAYHSGPDKTATGINDSAVSFFDLDKITDLVIQTGLIDWVINKRS